MAYAHSGDPSRGPLLQQQRTCPIRLDRLALSNELMRIGPESLSPRLREQYGAVVPIKLDPEGTGTGTPAWLVIGYEQVLQVCNDHQFFSRDSRFWRESREERVPASWWLWPQIKHRDITRFADPPYHQPRRDALIRALRHVDQVQTRLTATAYADQLIDRFCQLGKVEMIEEYARPLPLLVLARLFGLRGPDKQARLLDAIHRMLAGGKQAQRADEEVSTILQDLVEDRRLTPQDDLTSWLISAAPGLDDETVRSELWMMLSAGAGGTTNWIANVLHQLATDGRLRRGLAAGSITQDAVLRQTSWNAPPAENVMGAFPLQDTVLDGRRIKAGDMLVLGLGGANHDPALGRARSSYMLRNDAHAALSAGAHRCPGTEPAPGRTHHLGRHRTVVGPMPAHGAGHEPGPVLGALIRRSGSDPRPVRHLHRIRARTPGSCPTCLRRPCMAVTQSQFANGIPAPHELQLDTPLYRLDPLGRDFPGEGAALHRLGRPIVPVALPDPVVAWAVTRRDVADQLLTHPDMRKNPQYWKAYRDGLIPDTWPLLQILTAPTMLVVDDVDHTRLRQPIQRAFTPRRVEALRPRIEEIADELLDGIASTDSGTVVDLRETYAFQLPVTVICELYGVDDEAMRRQLAVDTRLLLNSTTPSEERLGAQASIFGTMAQLIDLKRAQPGDDLTTALIAEFDRGGMTGDELAGTLFLMLIAGHETTQNLLSNAGQRLLQHPEQLARVLNTGPGHDPWPGVVEEALRLDAPAATTMFLYAAVDVTIEGVTIREGQPVMIYTAAIGRDDHVFPHPHVFIADRANAHQHRAFGHGVHHCLGAPLARLEARLALKALFERFTVTAAEPLDAVERVPSLSSNAPARLPVYVTAREQRPA
ncbi:cytochrome P450 [Streptomyces sp. NRRL S-455]|uniref:cytochrome P450 n=1 Tax=Streptomyces sp. NRRL S-455 TaxID=1463908 RepID=UPI0006912217|nr:cytochrome P450 [Streptomyces sp. NRRL S-455]